MKHIDKTPGDCSPICGEISLIKDVFSSEKPKLLIQNWTIVVEISSIIISVQADIVLTQSIKDIITRP